MVSDGAIIAAILVIAFAFASILSRYYPEIYGSNKTIVGCLGCSGDSGGGGSETATPSVTSTLPARRTTIIAAFGFAPSTNDLRQSQFSAMVNDNMPTADVYGVDNIDGFGLAGLAAVNDQATKEGFVKLLSPPASGPTWGDPNNLISLISSEASNGYTLVELEETLSGIPTASNFNYIKAQVQKTYPNVLIGVTLGESDMATYLSQGAKPDFIGGEMYGSADSGMVSWYANEANAYGIPKVSMWISKDAGQSSLQLLYGRYDYIFLWAPGNGWDCSSCQSGGCGCQTSAPSYWSWAGIKNSIIASHISHPAPVGSFDSVDCNQISGWTCDSNNYSEAVSVSFYDNGVNGTLVGTTSADKQREQAVGNICGGNVYHGFVLKTPDSLKDGSQHTIYAFATSIFNGFNFSLSGDPKTITCPPPTTSTTSTASTTSTTTPSTTTTTTTTTQFTTSPTTSTTATTPLTISTAASTVPSISTTSSTTATYSTTSSVVSTTASTPTQTTSTTFTTATTPRIQPCGTYDVTCWIGYYILQIFSLTK